VMTPRNSVPLITVVILNAYLRYEETLAVWHMKGQ